eukprot:6481743-Amphidinium_carterae.1
MSSCLLLVFAALLFWNGYLPSRISSPSPSMIRRLLYLDDEFGGHRFVEVLRSVLDKRARFISVEI